MNRLLRGAEDLQLRKSIKPIYGGGQKEFIFDEQEFYDNIEEEDKFFTTQEKQSIIYDILNQIKVNADGEEVILHGRKVASGRKLISWCLSHEVITEILPIHDQQDLTELRNKWVFSWIDYQPLDKICNYFGIKIALYFSWLGFYTQALIVPALLGIGMYLSMNKDEVNQYFN